MLKKVKSKLNNDGNTFLVVLVSITCMSILIAAILAAVGYYYRACYTDLKSKNNFYELEKAMDEIYAGVGTDSIDSLMQAYSATVEIMVYYDVNSGKYVTLNEQAANDMLKQKFLQLIASNSEYKAPPQLYARLNSFIVDKPVDTDGDGVISEAEKQNKVELVDTSALPATEPKLYMEVVTTGTGPSIRYEKIVIHNVTLKRVTDKGYVQSITTDIEINNPEFDVSFSNINGETNAMYDFAMIADGGVEVNNATATNNQVVSITGNVYAAADYYNKNYNTSASATVGGLTTNRVLSTGKQINPARGEEDTSRYSGFYTNASNVTVTAEKFIVPGTIAVMNNGDLSVMGNIASGTNYADVWADNIVMAPTSVQNTSIKAKDGQLSIYGDIHVTDDFEINSDDAVVDFTGNYYGYNYSQTESSRQVLTGYATGKDHFYSSAIIVNGNNADVDFTGLDNLYVAGRAYIETTRTRQSTTTTGTDGKETITTRYETQYEKDANGNNVLVNKDVQTGESIAVRSNQLAYMPTIDANGNPVFTKKFDALNASILQKLKDENWIDPKHPVVKNTISGKDYYFLNFTSAAASAEFFDWYTSDNGLKKMAGYDQATDIVDVRAYADFEVGGISLGTAGSHVTNVTTSGAYTTGALNVAAGKTLSVTTPGNIANMVDGNAVITNFNKIASDNNINYKEMRYTLQLLDTSRYSGEQLTKMEQLKSDIDGANAEDLTPVNYYLDLTKLTKSLSAEKVGKYYVWTGADTDGDASGDVTVTAPTGTDGKVQGMIIARGDVTFDSSVKKFEGLIIAGGKIKVDHAMDFVANEEVVKTILRTVDGEKDNPTQDRSWLCSIFKDYVSTSGTGGDTSVSNIGIGDIIQYENWKKNVE